MKRSLFWLTICLCLTTVSGYWLSTKFSGNVFFKTSKSTPRIPVESLIIKGSNTVGENFIPLIARDFLYGMDVPVVKNIPLESSVEQYVEGEVLSQNKKLRIEISAHGSSTGFKALLERSTQIAMSSRPIKIGEKKALEQLVGRVNEYPIALDALAIITHAENPLESLTIEQIAQIFSGEVTNWKSLGGNDQPIELYSRDDNSGTWDTFKNLVLKTHKKALSPESARYESSNQLVSMVEATPGAIGFVGAAYADGGKLLSISKSAGEAGSKPTGYTIGTEAYPLSRKLYLYTVGNKQSELVDAFVDFATRNEGQKLADQVGLVSYYPTHYRPKKVAKDTPQLYRGLTSLASRITVDFDNGSSKIDTAKENRDLDRLKNFAHHNPKRSIVLVDFSASPRLAELKSKLEAQEIRVLDTLSLDYTTRKTDNIEVWVL